MIRLNESYDAEQVRKIDDELVKVRQKLWRNIADICDEARKRPITHDLALMVFVSLGTQQRFSDECRDELKHFISEESKTLFEFKRQKGCPVGDGWTCEQIGVALTRREQSQGVSIVLEQRKDCDRQMLAKMATALGSEFGDSKSSYLKKCREHWGTAVEVDTAITSKRALHCVFVVPQGDEGVPYLAQHKSGMLSPQSLLGEIQKRLSTAGFQDLAGELSSLEFAYFKGSIIVVTSSLSESAARLLQSELRLYFQDRFLPLCGAASADRVCPSLRFKELPGDAKLLYRSLFSSSSPPPPPPFPPGGPVSRSRRIDLEALFGLNRATQPHGNPHMGLEYHGEVVEGEMHGRGTLRNLLGKYDERGDYEVGTNGFRWHTCEGEFKNDKMTGQGEATNPCDPCVHSASATGWRGDGCAWCGLGNSSGRVVADVQLLTLLVSWLLEWVSRQDHMAGWRSLPWSRGAQPAVRGDFDAGQWRVVRSQVCKKV